MSSSTRRLGSADKYRYTRRHLSQRIECWYIWLVHLLLIAMASTAVAAQTALASAAIEKDEEAAVAAAAAIKEKVVSSPLRRRNYTEWVLGSRHRSVSDSMTMKPNVAIMSVGENQIDDAFTIVFVSDLENRYRNHSPERCRYVLEYIRDLVQLDLYYDNEYNYQKINPQLVLHGGDNNHMLGCENWPWIVCRSVRKEWDEVWRVTFDANLPLLTAFGNHDWQTATGTSSENIQLWGSRDDPHLPRTNVINQRAQDIVTRTYKESSRIGVQNVQEFVPKGRIGPVLYRSYFQGVQIVNMNIAFPWESYDDTGTYSTDSLVDELFNSLDRSQTTLFFQHYPISDLNFVDSFDNVIARLQTFTRAVLLVGHQHVARNKTYPPVNPELNPLFEYVAPYPHTWGDETPGFYALLVSPSQGVLQVKRMNLPGKMDGEACNIYSTCRECHSGENFWYSVNGYRCGSEPLLQVGQSCNFAFGSCSTCPNRNLNDIVQYACPWWGFFLFFCRCI